MVKTRSWSYRVLRHILNNGNEEQRRFVVWVLERERMRRGLGPARCR